MAVAIDPVCGMDVDIETATLVTEYKGVKYYFCGRGCLLEFEEDPESYLKPDAERTKSM
jgi:YHS domain-containing protein